MTRMYSAVLTLALLVPSAQAMVQVGAGSYTTQLPQGRLGPSDKNKNPVLPKVSSDFAKPVMTSKWWTSLIWQFNPDNPFSENLFAHPLAFHAWGNGLDVGYNPDARVTPETLNTMGWKSMEYHYDAKPDFTVNVLGLTATKTTVSDYSDWTVTAQWQAGTRNFKATMVVGSPFVYFTAITGDQLSINFKGVQTIWSNNNGVLGLTINGHHYGIFAPAGSVWTDITTGTIKSTLTGKDYCAIAALPDNTPATLEFYRKHAYAYVTDSKVSWNYDTTAGMLNAQYAVQTTLKEAANGNVANTLLALYRHQWLNTNATFTPYIYKTNCGDMKVLDGNNFAIALEFDGILPALPLVAVDGQDTFSKQTLYNRVDDIFKQSRDQRWQNTFVAADTYWGGKAMARVAHLVRIAEQVGHTQARDLFLTELKAKLAEWFTVGNESQFYYDSNWDTLIGYPDSYGSNTELSDHHFHYGYFFQAAAVIAQYDPAWASDAQYGGMVKMLIKDIANTDRADTKFGFLRVFDIYKGHSWANGAALFGSGNNEESSSEAMNAYAGIILFASAVGDNALRDLGIFLYTHERAAIEQYWFDINDVVFPPTFNRPTVGMIWSDGGSYAIWWGGKVEEVHGINFIPIEPGSLYLGRNPNYLKINQDYMQANGGGNDDWRDIHMQVKAFYDPAGAIAMYNAGYTPEAGETPAHTYHWIHNLNALGKFDISVNGNIPTSAVFNKNGAKTYVAYNPSNADTTVNFSDGATLAVPARTLATSKGSVTPPPPTVEPQFSASAAESSSCVLKLSFKPGNFTPQNVTLRTQINGGAQQNYVLSNTNGSWDYVVSGLNAGDKVTYWYTYDYNGVNRDTTQTVYNYNACNVTPPAQPVFTQWVERRAAFNFQPQWQSSAVSLNYAINNGAQQKIDLTQTNGSWNAQIAGIKAGDVVTYTFTYEYNGANSTSQQFTYNA